MNREGIDICGIRLVRCCGLGPGLTLLQSQSHVWVTRGFIVIFYDSHSGRRRTSSDESRTLSLFSGSVVPL